MEADDAVRLGEQTPFQDTNFSVTYQRVLKSIDPAPDPIVPIKFESATDPDLHESLSLFGSPPRSNPTPPGSLAEPPKTHEHAAASNSAASAGAKRARSPGLREVPGREAATEAGRKRAHSGRAGDSGDLDPVRRRVGSPTPRPSSDAPLAIAPIFLLCAPGRVRPALS